MSGKITNITQMVELDGSHTSDFRRQYNGYMNRASPFLNDNHPTVVVQSGDGTKEVPLSIETVLGGDGLHTPDGLARPGDMSEKDLGKLYGALVKALGVAFGNSPYFGNSLRAQNAEVALITAHLVGGFEDPLIASRFRKGFERYPDLLSGMPTVDPKFQASYDGVHKAANETMGLNLPVAKKA